MRVEEGGFKGMEERESANIPYEVSGHWTLEMPGWPRPTLDCHSGRPEEGPDHRMERHTWEPKTKIHPCLVTDSPKLQQLVQQVVKDTKFIIKSKIYLTTKT